MNGADRRVAGGNPIEDQLGALFISPEMRTVLAASAAPRRRTRLSDHGRNRHRQGSGRATPARLLAARQGPFVAFNCTSSPRDVIDSQLFGHRRGAFTGAVEHAPGIVRSAERGTLLLDEVGDMPLELQPKLLRFLSPGMSIRSEKHGRRRWTCVSSPPPTPASRPSSRRVSFGKTSTTRLNIVELRLPPLRERRADIPPLANHYLKKGAAENRKGDLRLAEDTMEYLLLYRWPGNVRQLANEMRKLAVMAERARPSCPNTLSMDIAASRRTVPAAVRPADSREVTVRLDQPLAAMLEHVERSAVAASLVAARGKPRGRRRDAGPDAQGPVSEAPAIRVRVQTRIGCLTAPEAG
jgi:DNA-binding NtrC family response regulator